ncbi:EGF-like domain protein (macronuclear) [Tetrahymena thermophila SB210]|uniref:EGF-like domain protein n=1 Tax=Tetrahymena thermophila (strain SB210) TaxID=312017 RepID=I7LX91_TETTS|nr:EGF-like domain protein [Tetrahymena thermophila SB210]EAS03983.2 EGF-like domain protein [Tetrahymena thermophila SB210]|eukprot:XP_001024228.2 EGF-like domain protein [Tetrahymena thermophila SB210]
MKKVKKGKQIILFLIIQNIFIYCQSFSFTSNTLTSTNLGSNQIISVTYKSVGVVATCQQNQSVIKAISFSNTYAASNKQSYSGSQNCISVQFYQSDANHIFLSIFQQSGFLLNYGGSYISQYNTAFSTSSNTYTQTVSVQSSVQSEAGILVGFSSGEIKNFFQNVNHQTFNNCTNQVIGLWYSQISSVNLVFAACGSSKIFIYDKNMISQGQSVQQTIYYAINSFQITNNINLIKFIKMGVDANYTCGGVSKDGQTYTMNVYYYSSNTFNNYKSFPLNNDFVDIYGFTSYFMVLYQKFITVYNFDGNTLGQSTPTLNQFTLFSFLNYGLPLQALRLARITVYVHQDLLLVLLVHLIVTELIQTQIINVLVILVFMMMDPVKLVLNVPFLVKLVMDQIITIVNHVKMVIFQYQASASNVIRVAKHVKIQTTFVYHVINLQDLELQMQQMEHVYAHKVIQKTKIKFVLVVIIYVWYATLKMEVNAKVVKIILYGIQHQITNVNAKMNFTLTQLQMTVKVVIFRVQNAKILVHTVHLVKIQLDGNQQVTHAPVKQDIIKIQVLKTAKLVLLFVLNVTVALNCQEGFYLDISTNDCNSCNFPCIKCLNSSTSCTSCKNTTTWQLVNNTCSCKTGYYLDLSSKECQACTSLCSECNSSTQCTSCKNSSSMQLINQICKCKDGYYQDISSNDCLPCPPLCSACTSSNFCTSCKNSMSMQISNNMCQCSSGFHLSQDQRNCTNCSNLCQTCNNDPNYCLSCKNQPGWSLDQNKNTCYCTDGYYFDTTKQICQQCSSNCKTCKDQSSYCQSCYNSYYLANNQCSQEAFPTNISQKTIETLTQTTQSAAYIAIGSTTASSIIFSIASPNGGAVQQFMSVQKLYFLLFIDIVYPQLIYAFFKTLSGTSPLILFKKINLFSYFIQEDQNQIIKQTTNGIVFTQYQYKHYRLLEFQDYIPNKFNAEKVTSSVVQNGGGPIISILAIWILVLPIFSINYLRKKNKYGNLLKSSPKESSLYTQDVTTKERIYYYYKRVISILTVMLHETIIIVLSFSVVLQIIILLNLQNNQF